MYFISSLARFFPEMQLLLRVQIAYTYTIIKTHSLHDVFTPTMFLHRKSTKFPRMRFYCNATQQWWCSDGTRPVRVWFTEESTYLTLLGELGVGPSFRAIFSVGLVVVLGVTCPYGQQERREEKEPATARDHSGRGGSPFTWPSRQRRRIPSSLSVHDAASCHSCARMYHVGVPPRPARAGLLSPGRASKCPKFVGT